MASKANSAINIITATSVSLSALFVFAYPAQSKGTKSNSGALVPPPPPVVVPSGLNVFFPGQTPVEYLSEDQLKTTRQDVVTRLEAAHSDLVEKEERNEELEKRAKLFTSLIEEGVVSRRELQTAERESKTAAQDLIAAQETAKTLEDELSRIDGQLAHLAKKKPSKAGKTKSSK